MYICVLKFELNVCMYTLCCMVSFYDNIQKKTWNGEQSTNIQTDRGQHKNCVYKRNIIYGFTFITTT